LGILSHCMSEGVELLSVGCLEGILKVSLSSSSLLLELIELSKLTLKSTFKVL